MPTIHEVLAPFAAGAVTTPATWQQVEATLLAREDKIREDLHIIAMRLGSYPEFVAMAFAEVGLGTPPSPEAMQMLQVQFQARHRWLQQMIATQMGLAEGEVPDIADPTQIPDNPDEQ